MFQTDLYSTRLRDGSLYLLPLFTYRVKYMSKRDEFEQYRQRRPLADVSAKANNIFHSVTSNKTSRAPFSVFNKSGHGSNLVSSKVSKVGPIGVRKVHDYNHGRTQGIKISSIKHLAPVRKQKSKSALSVLNLPLVHRKTTDRQPALAGDKRTCFNYNSVVSESNRAIEKFDSWYQIQRYSFTGKEIDAKCLKSIYLIKGVNQVGKFLLAVELNGESSEKSDNSDKRDNCENEGWEAPKDRNLEVCILMNPNKIKLEIGDSITLGQSKILPIDGQNTRVFSTWRMRLKE